MSLCDSKATAPELKSKWVEASGTNVSAQTVRRRLLDKGLRGCVAAGKPRLTENHKRKWLQWAKERRLWTTSDGGRYCGQMSQVLSCGEPEEEFGYAVGKESGFWTNV